jgi:hypothetical protein
MGRFSANRRDESGRRQAGNERRLISEQIGNESARSMTNRTGYQSFIVIG